MGVCNRRAGSRKFCRSCPTFYPPGGACATTSDDPGLSFQHSDMDIDLDVSVGLTDSDAYAYGVTIDELVVPSPTPSAPHPLLCSSGTHDHPADICLASVHFQVRGFNGRGAANLFRTNLNLSFGSRMTTTITKATKPIRMRAQYPHLRLFTSTPIPRNAVCRRRRDCRRIATIAGATRAGPKYSVQ